MQNISEGLYDPGIFKAFFLAGGPGSGKSFVTASAFSGTGLKLVNSDTKFERDLKKAGLSMKMPDDEEYFRNLIRGHAKRFAVTQLDQYNMLKQLGYDCYMVFVNTTLEVALARNARRERTIPEYITKSSWQGVQANMGRFQKIFGQSNFLVVDNNKSDLELTTLIMNRVRKEVNKYMRAPISSYIAKRWMAGERKAKRR